MVLFQQYCNLDKVESSSIKKSSSSLKLLMGCWDQNSHSVYENLGESAQACTHYSLHTHYWEKKKSKVLKWGLRGNQESDSVTLCREKQVFNATAGKHAGISRFLSKPKTNPSALSLQMHVVHNYMKHMRKR